MTDPRIVDLALALADLYSDIEVLVDESMARLPGTFYDALDQKTDKIEQIILALCS